MSFNGDKNVEMLSVRSVVSQDMYDMSTIDVVQVAKKDMFSKISEELYSNTDKYPIDVSIDDLESGDTVLGVDILVMSKKEYKRLKAIEKEYELLRDTLFYGAVRIKQCEGE